MVKLEQTELLALLGQYPNGFTFEQIMSEVEGDGEALLSQIKNLWDSGELTGVVSDGCCGTGCADYCVSYMNKDRPWSLKQ